MDQAQCLRATTAPAAGCRCLRRRMRRRGTERFPFLFGTTSWLRMLRRRRRTVQVAELVAELVRQWQVVLTVAAAEQLVARVG
ncbi:hypothetical protein V6Z11_D03G156800 [Gossypium hirsutum]